MNAQVRRKLRSRFYGVVGNDNIRGAVVEDTDNRAVLHRATSQVTHTHICALAVEVATLQVWQLRTNRIDLADCRQCLYLIIHKLRDINGDITTITLCPTLLPEITCHFGNLLDLGSECRAIFQY